MGYKLPNAASGGVLIQEIQLFLGRETRRRPSWNVGGKIQGRADGPNDLAPGDECHRSKPPIRTIGALLSLDPDYLGE